MFQINDDNSIYVTRGDVAFFSITASNDADNHSFQVGDVVRIKVFSKKNCDDIVLQKDFPVTTETEEVEIVLTKKDTKIGETINKPKDYWYEVELNPLTEPQTIIGYDEEGGPKIFRLFPEGRDILDEEVEEEDIPVVDKELDVTSTRPVENQAVARAVAQLEAKISKLLGQ